MSKIVRVRVSFLAPLVLIELLRSSFFIQFAFNLYDIIYLEILIKIITNQIIIFDTIIMKGDYYG